MEGMTGFGMTLCVGSIITAVFSQLVHGSRMKKALSLVLGVFVLTAVTSSVRGVVESLRGIDLSSDVTEWKNDDADYEQAVLKETSDHLVRIANELLLSEGIEAENIKLSLRVNDDGSIYINRLIIYIKQSDENMQDEIGEIIYRNFAKKAEIVIDG